MVYTMGEMLIDMIADQNGHFEACAGGAPANVAAAVAKLGGEAAFIGAISRDSFGQMLYSTLFDIGVNMELTQKTDAKTALAFVMLSDGDRRFEFYRSLSADMCYLPENLPDDFLQVGDILHFGSVALMPSPTRDTHIKALKQARRQGAVISFDVNLRQNLWNDDMALKKAINEAIPFADIVKMSEDEYEFVTGFCEEKQAAESLLLRSAEAVVISKGEKGAAVYLKNGSIISKSAYRVGVTDTVGAGDALMGSLLYSIDGSEDKDLCGLNWDMILDFANAVAAFSVSKKGGIPSLPTFLEAMEILKIK